MDKLIQLMKSLLATLVSYKIKTQNYHWNIEGPDFVQYHGLLGDVYGAADGDIDTVAEHIRALGSYAPGSLARFQELTTIEDESAIPEALEMINRTLTDNQKILQLARAAATVAEGLGERGVLNFLEGIIDSYEKQAWMLRATVKR